jgi:hypothetical protein
VTKHKRRPPGQTLGAIIVGFDQQIFRTLPPAEELVAKSAPVRGLSGKDDGIKVILPDDEAPLDSPEPEDRDTAE